MKKLKVPYGKLVEPYIPVFINAGNVCNMAKLLMLCYVEILEDGPGGNYPIVKILNPESL